MDALVVAGGMQILSPQLEPLTEPQRMLVGGLQNTSTQAEDALSQGMEKLQQNLAETLTAEADPFGPPDAYMMQMVTAVDKLKELVGFVTQVKPVAKNHPSPFSMDHGCKAWSARIPDRCSPVRPLLGWLCCAGGPSPADDAAADAQDPDDAAGGQGPPGARRLLPAPPHAELAVGGAPAGGGD
jgi:hypothetical protein